MLLIEVALVLLNVPVLKYVAALHIALFSCVAVVMHFSYGNYVGAAISGGVVAAVFTSLYFGGIRGMFGFSVNDTLR